MPIAEMRIKNFRAFADSGIVRLGGVTPIAGRNDVGKSGLLHALREKTKADGKGLRETWVDATLVEKKLRDILPQLIGKNDLRRDKNAWIKT